MRVQEVQIRRFSLFQETALCFSPGLNVLIGENATGKSHLLKLLYSMLHTAYTMGKDNGVDETLAAARLREKLAMVFRPDSLQVNRLVHRGRGRDTAKVSMHTDAGQISFRLTTSGNVYVDTCGIRKTEAPVFVPSREAIAMYPGFVQAYENRELAFDETYRDLCVALSGSPARGPRRSEAAGLVAPLEHILGGKVRLVDDRFCVHSKDGIIEAHLLAEGFRKIASIVRLINNGSLMGKGILFWDEPEANLNPKLIAKICEALRQLVASGIQVFVATHDYLLSQELSLAAEYETVPQVDTRFFAFSRSAKGKAAVEWGDTLADLDHNPILDEFAAHYDREHQLFGQS